MSPYPYYIREMLSEMLCWNDYNLFYLAKRISLPHTTLLHALQGRNISRQSAYRILCYYHAYRDLRRFTT